MKKLTKMLILVMAASMLLTLAACGKSDDSAAKTTAGAAATEADKAVETPPEEVKTEGAAAPAVDEALLGQYDATSYVYSDTELETTGEWIKLESADRGIFFITGKEYPFSYTLDGENFKMEQDVGVTYEGTFKDGIITLNMPMTVYTFEKK